MVDHPIRILIIASADQLDQG